MRTSCRQTGLLACVLLLACVVAGFASGDALLARLGRSRPASLVNDYANVLTRTQRSALEGLLEELDRKSGTQVAVAVLPSLDGGEIDDFATRLYEEWGVGRKGVDKGVLLLVALQDRKARIEVGYGLEGVLPDAAAGRILDQYVLPAFRQDRYAEGIVAGAVALAQIAAKDAGVTLSGGMPRGLPQQRAPRRGNSVLGFILMLIMIPVFIRHPWLLLFLMSSGRGGGFSGGGFGGGFGGFGGGLSGGGGASRGW